MLSVCTIYKNFCMIFIASAVMYHGLILFKLQKISKFEDATSTSNENKIGDQLVLLIYVIIFTIFNIYYFISYVFLSYIKAFFATYYYTYIYSASNFTDAVSKCVWHTAIRKCAIVFTLLMNLVVFVLRRFTNDGRGEQRATALEIRSGIR